jgi:outer membrane lipoprotein SlyB
VFYRAVEKLGDGSAPTGWVLYAINAISLAVLAVFSFWVMRRRRGDGEHDRREISFLLLFAVLLMAAYSTWVFGVFFFTRYFYPVYFVATVFAACVLQDLVTWVSVRRPVFRVAVTGAFVLYAIGLVFMGMTSAYRSTPVYRFYDIARWVEENTSEEETIGVFQGGAIGYFSNRHVVNLDGKVNGSALEALRAGDMCGYVARSGIDIVMDHADVLELFLGPDAGSATTGMETTRCFTGSTIGAMGWVGYRLGDAENTAGGEKSRASAGAASLSN